MTTDQIRFDNGAAYEKYMGHWSQLVGEQFLKWLSPKPNLRWLDVGCGTGAFTDLILKQTSPSSVHGIDPSEEQLVFARAQNTLKTAQFLQGDAVALPFSENTFDIAVMPLVLFFVSDPAKGVSEMVRVVERGGMVSAYSWDLPGEAFPHQELRNQMIKLGIQVPLPPHPEVSSIENLKKLWTKAGLTQIETSEITVERTYPDFNDYWNTLLGAPSAGAKLAAMPPKDLALLQQRLKENMKTDAKGRLLFSARANAVKGRK